MLRSSFAGNSATVEDHLLPGGHQRLVLPTIFDRFVDFLLVFLELEEGFSDLVALSHDADVGVVHTGLQGETLGGTQSRHRRVVPHVGVTPRLERCVHHPFICKALNQPEHIEVECK